MQNRLTRRQFTGGVTMATLGVTVGLAGCLGGDDDVPDVSFSFDRDDTDLTVTHDGGDALDEDNTGAVQVTETTDGDTVLGSWELPIAEDDSEIFQGRFESGNTLVVRWFTPDQEEFADLASYDIE